jgi:hypothetical protein
LLSPSVPSPAQSPLALLDPLVGPARAPFEVVELDPDLLEPIALGIVEVMRDAGIDVRGPEPSDAIALATRDVLHKSPSGPWPLRPLLVLRRAFAFH